MSTMSKCPISSMSEIPWTIRSNSFSLLEDFCPFYITCWEWFCHGITILVVFIHFKKFCHHPLILENVFFLIFYFVYGLEILYCPWEFFDSKMIESNASLVFTPLNPPINIVLNNSTACVGRAIIAFDKCRWMQPLSELTEVHF